MVLKVDMFMYIPIHPIHRVT